MKRTTNKLASKLGGYASNYRGITGLVCSLLSSFVFVGILPAILLPLLLMPVIYLLVESSVKTGFIKYVWPFLVYFLVFHALVLSWMLKSDISEATSFSSLGAKVAVIISWLLMIGVTTLVMMLLPALFYIVRSRLPKLNLYLLVTSIAGFWTVAEYLRSMAFGAFLYGPGGTVGDFWNFGSFGLAAMNTPLNSLASLVGLYGLSLLVVALSCGLYYLIFKRDFRLMLAVLSLTVLLGIGNSWVLGAGQVDDRSMEISLMSQQNSLASSANSLPIQPHRETGKELIVLPEYSEVYIDGRSKQAEQLEGRLNSDAVSIDVVEDIKGERYASLVTRDSSGGEISSQTKQFLIPTGEYMPYIFRWFFTVVGSQNLIQQYDDQQAISKGQPPETVLSGGYKIGTIACSGILNRAAYTNLTKQGAEVLTNSASLTIFNGSKVYFDQSLAMAKFHAVANHRPFVQATKGAPSFVIASNGQYVMKPEVVANRFSDVAIKPSKQTTIYSQIGEWVLYVCAVFSVFMIGLSGMRKRLSNKKAD